MKSLQDFINLYSGKIVDDGNGGYRGECVSLCKRFLLYQGWPMLRGNAIMWQYNGGGSYKWIKNYVWTVPQAGDIAVFQVGNYGHIGIVVSANVRTLDVFNQNWPTGNDTDPATITRYNYTSPKVLGFLRHI